MTESQLIDRCKSKNIEAQRILYERFAPKMFALCLRYVDDYDAAQDVLQDGFLKVFEKIGTVLNESALTGWMKRIFINTALDYLRKKKSFVSFETVEWKDEIPSEEINWDETDRIGENQLMEMVRSLPAGYSAVFNMVAIEDLSHKEVANLLNISEVGVRSQYARARKMLMRMVRDYQERNK